MVKAASKCQTCGNEIFLSSQKWVARFDLLCKSSDPRKTWTAPHIPVK